MRIAQIAPLAESVPPKYYGGTERVVSYLTEELVREGHDVTLFASGDSVTRARLVAVREEAQRQHHHCADGMPYDVLMLEQVLQRELDFDIVHFHVDFLQFPLMRRMTVPSVSTLHGRLDLPEIGPLFREFVDIPLTSISDSQREPLPWAGWCGTVYHGLPADLYAPRPDPAQRLVFLGRISPEKRVEQAIEVAVRAEMPLRIAAKVDPVDREYFEAVVRPLLDHPLVEFVGEIGDADKQEFLGDAAGLLFTIDWPEPFGLVMIEAMACGTPVIAYRRGSVPEVLDDEETGFIVDGVDAAVAAVARLPEIRRGRCRETFERRFTAERMARDYVSVYQGLASRSASAEDRQAVGV